MSEIIQLDIPNVSFDLLTEWARREDVSVEQLRARLLSATVGRLVDDPVLQLAGTIETGVPDLSESHDTYLAEALMDEMKL